MGRYFNRLVWLDLICCLDVDRKRMERKDGVWGKIKGGSPRACM